MTTADLIYQKVKNLPDEKQIEVLDFLEYLDLKSHVGAEGMEIDWASFSLAAAMRGMESEAMPEYALSDLKERF
jgi:hypothetical protein